MFSFFKKKDDIILDQPTCLVSVINGKAIPLEDVEDDTFSSKLLGEGVAFCPINDEVVVAPADGLITAASNNMMHACGMTLPNGMEILIHVGIDTVELNGQGFELLVHEGQKVKMGAPLIKFSKEIIEKAGLQDTIMLIVTEPVNKNIENYLKEGIVEKGITVVASWI